MPDSVRSRCAAGISVGELSLMSFLRPTCAALVGCYGLPVVLVYPRRRKPLSFYAEHLRVARAAAIRHRKRLEGPHHERCSLEKTGAIGVHECRKCLTGRGYRIHQAALLRIF